MLPFSYSSLVNTSFKWFIHKNINTREKKRIRREKRPITEYSIRLEENIASELMSSYNYSDSRAMSILTRDLLCVHVECKFSYVIVPIDDFPMYTQPPKSFTLPTHNLFRRYSKVSTSFVTLVPSHVLRINLNFLDVDCNLKKKNTF